MMGDFTTLSVFCGSKRGADPAYAEAGQRLGSLMAEQGIRLVYGGGAIGLMGVIASAVLDGGGHVTGVIPDFLMQYEVGNPGVSELIVVDSMHDRKRRIFEMSDGFVIMPGGLGTLDETFEIITWKQLQLHAKPIVVVNVAGYWDPLVAIFERAIGSDFAHPAVSELFTMVSSPDEVFEALRSAPEPNIEVLTSHL